MHWLLPSRQILHRSIRCSYKRSAISGAPAFTKLGRLPFLQSAYKVNWLMTNSSPPTSARLKLVFPFSSSKIRSLQILSAILSVISSVSEFSTPKRIINPFPIFPKTSPSTVTLALVTLCSTALTVSSSYFITCLIYVSKFFATSGWYSTSFALVG